MSNTEKFTGRAEVYAKSKPGYANKFIDYLFDEVGISKHSVIADIGSGTGILSRDLLERGSDVFCVEPNQDMREVAERTLSEFPNFHSVDRSAENTTLPEDIVDFITVAQAFHWFDPDNFKVECQRILKPDGKVILIWNSRIKTQKFVKENESICKKFCPSFTGFSGGLEFIDDVISRFYNNNFELKHFANDLFFDKSKFIGTGLSVSYALKETDNEYKNYISALENLFDKYAVDGILTVPNETVAYIGKV